LVRLIFIAYYHPHLTVYRWRPSFSGCRCSCLEQFAWKRHRRIFPGCFTVPSHNPSALQFIFYAFCGCTVPLDTTCIIIIVYLLMRQLTSNLVILVRCQGWEDERLVWNASDFENIDHTFVKLDDLWVPDITMMNRWAILLNFWISN